MQPAPTDTLQTVQSQNSPAEPSVTSQHGIRPDDVPVPSVSPSGRAARTVTPPGEAEESHDAPAVQELGQSAQSPTPLKLPFRKSSSPAGNRVIKYENAAPTSAPRKMTDPLEFKGIKTPHKTGDESCSIDKLPNEILTHALSLLSPNDLSAIALVSHRFHDLVTTPHAWRDAFTRYFPGPESLTQSTKYLTSQDNDASEVFKSQKRFFTRLTALASWRSEYILRTGLLRSLARGKPVQIAPTPSNMRSGQSHVASPITRYNSQLYTTVNHIHATFGTGLNKRMPRFIHGADDNGTATTSDPAAAKVDSWGLYDMPLPAQFAELVPGVAQYGLGAGEVVGVPNMMDVSQTYGMIAAGGCPNGLVYFRHIEEMRRRPLALSASLSAPELGIPKLSYLAQTPCSVWLAKTAAIPTLSEGMIGIMTGTSAGVMNAYSLGSDGLRDRRLVRGELTARWVLCPGVPIIAMAVDEAFSLKRQAQNRIWAVALNALGELFYLTKFPKRPNIERNAKFDEEAVEKLAWANGRTVFWNLVEQSRRTARPDPYQESRIDRSYSPRSSWNGMCLSGAQIAAEAREMEAFLLGKPKDIQRACLGWDMRRRLEVDFAGNDEHMAGEAMLVFGCGLDEGTTADIRRYTRCRIERPKMEVSEAQNSFSPIDLTPTVERPSLFGTSTPTTTSENSGLSRKVLERRVSRSSTDSTPDTMDLLEEWRVSQLTFNGHKSLQITKTAIDQSTYATLTLPEDPALGFAGMSAASSPFASPMRTTAQPATAADIPGQRARFVAAGTSTGNVFLWDMRSPVSRTTDLVNKIDPVRIIYTDSPEISCLALTALYLVHGGNDGLVQAWDPLASSIEPIRTLHSRFSSRARRRLVQAQARPQGVGINLFAAGAICLDPDPTVLRGIVSLGTHLRYWSYSSSAADQYKSKKRQLRYGERGTNGGGDRFSSTGRGSVKDYIANEKHEIEMDKREREREAKRLEGRFGVDLHDNEEEALAYAAMLSEESLMQDMKRRESHSTAGPVTPPTSSDFWTPVSATPESSQQFTSPPVKSDDELDADIAEAIRLSLAGGEVTSPSNYYSPSPWNQYDIPIRLAKSKSKKQSPTTSRRGSPTGGATSSKQKELDDLEFALQLSLAEEESRKANEEAEVEAQDEFPALTPTEGSGKGKGKGRADWV